MTCDARVPAPGRAVLNRRCGKPAVWVGTVHDPAYRVPDERVWPPRRHDGRRVALCEEHRPSAPGATRAAG